MRTRPITILVLIALAAALIAGCSAAGPKPDQVVTDFLKAIKAGDYAAADKFVVSGSSWNFSAQTQSEPAMIRAILDRLTYRVLNSSTNGNFASVEVELTAVNLGPIVGEVMAQMMSLALSGVSDTELQKQADTALLDKIKSPTAAMLTSKVTVPLTKVDGKWLIAPTQEAGNALADALTGGLLSALKDFN